MNLTYLLDLMQAFQNAIFHTAVQQLTRFQPTVRLTVPLLYLKLKLLLATLLMEQCVSQETRSRCTTKKQLRLHFMV